MNARAVGRSSDITLSMAGSSDLCEEFLGVLCDESALCEESPVECDDPVSLCPALSGSQFYLVFVDDENVVYNWRLEKADPDNPRLPVDHETRFKQRLL
jgi:hypothetical protein